MLIELMHVPAHAHYTSCLVTLTASDYHYDMPPIHSIRAQPLRLLSTPYLLQVLQPFVPHINAHNTRAIY